MIAKQQHNRFSFAIDVELYRDVVVIDSLLVLAQVTIIEILKNITAHSRKICPSYFNLVKYPLYDLIYIWLWIILVILAQ